MAGESMERIIDAAVCVLDEWIKNYIGEVYRAIWGNLVSAEDSDDDDGGEEEEAGDEGGRGRGRARGRARGRGRGRPRGRGRGNEEDDYRERQMKYKRGATELLNFFSWRR